MGEVMKKKENTAFVCENCGTFVSKHSNGSYRNHCNVCLYSKHLDIIPGDRSSDCYGIMEPVGQRIHSKKGLQILHRCSLCNHKQWNKIDEAEDDLEIILGLIIY